MAGTRYYVRVARRLEDEYVTMNSKETMT